ncbi:MAG: hypothetical protein AAF614_10015 [Chloroflexota bacterium]
MLNFKPTSETTLYTLRYAILAILFALLIILLAAQPVGGSVVDGAQWVVTFDFANGQSDGILAVEVGAVVNDELMVTDRYEETLFCQPIGTVRPRPNGLYFDGSSYLACNFPDIGKIVSDMTSGDLILRPSCKATDAWAEGSVWFNPQGIVESNGTIFYHPDLELNGQLNPNRRTAALTWRVDSGRAVSGSFPLVGDETFRAWIEPGGWLGGVLPGFVVNGASLLAYGHQLSNVLEVSTGATTVYIGHAPGGVNFNGVISHLVVDPACIGGGI